MILNMNLQMKGLVMIYAELMEQINNIGGKYGDRECFYADFVFTIQNIPKNTVSDIICFNIGERISLDFIRMYCESTDYSLELYDKETCSGFNKLLVKENINKWSAFNDYEQNGSILIINRDQPKVPHLYGKIINNSAIDTGLITINFLVAST